MVVKKTAGHALWLGIAVIGLAFNWLWWLDSELRPAVVSDPAKTEVLNVNRAPETTFPLGDPVLIRGHGTIKRKCPKEYIRNLEFPNGDRIPLQSGYGMRFEPRDEGYIIIRIDTSPDWPPGRYVFDSYGKHDCNPPFPPQIIPGIRAEFWLQ